MLGLGFISCQKNNEVKPSTPVKTYTYKYVNFVLTPPSGYRSGGMGTIYYKIDGKQTPLMDNDVWNGPDTQQQAYFTYSCPVGSVVYYSFSPVSLSTYRNPLLSISIENNILFINSTTLTGNFSVQ